MANYSKLHALMCAFSNLNSFAILILPFKPWFFKRNETKRNYKRITMHSLTISSNRFKKSVKKYDPSHIFCTMISVKIKTAINHYFTIVFYYNANKHPRLYTVSLEYLYAEKRHPLKKKKLRQFEGWHAQVNSKIYMRAQNSNWFLHA